MSPLPTITVTTPVYLPPKPERPPLAPPVVRPQARYDAAQTGTQNRAHWSGADDMSANAAADPEVRRRLRRRARYERDNNPGLNGLVRTLAHETVGTGPRLLLDLGEPHEAAARGIEGQFKRWCRAVNLADKLRVMREARPVDGEAFGLLTTNPAVRHPVKLDVRLVEADQVETPGPVTRPTDVSGVEFDADGNPAYYHVLRQHPGDSGWWNWAGEFDRVPARLVLHWFVPSRPGQARGVPEITPSLETVAQLRRYDLAVLSAAETAASIAGVIRSGAGDTSYDAEGSGEGRVEDFAEVAISRNALLKLPDGQTIEQFKAEQPTANYGEYKAAKMAEVGRPLLAPRNIATADSSSFNYSSGRLDHQPFHRSVWIDRAKAESDLLDRLFLAWLAEARLVGLLPDGLPDPDGWGVEWQWDGFTQLDPLKDTKAAELRITLGLSTLAEECAAEGRDWRQVMAQRAKEVAFARALGLAPATPPAGTASAPPTIDAEESADA